VKKIATYFLALDQKFFNSKNTIIRTFDLVPKKSLQILALDQKFLKPKIPLLELLI
jgi:hypothetical protein